MTWMTTAAVLLTDCADPARSRLSRRPDEHSGGLGEIARALRGSAPGRGALLLRFREAAPPPVGVVILRIDGRPGLLPPRVVEAAGVHGVEADLVDQPHDRGLRVRVVTGDRECDATRAVGTLAEFEQMLRVDVVEGFDHGTAQLLC